jgi:hypothetical protein
MKKKRTALCVEGPADGGVSERKPASLPPIVDRGPLRVARLLKGFLLIFFC